MKITEVICQVLRIPQVEAKTASSQDALLLRVRTDSGLEGIGEADSSPEVVQAIVDAPFSHNVASGLRHVLLGENPLETERLWQKMYRSSAPALLYLERTLRPRALWRGALAGHLGDGTSRRYLQAHPDAPVQRAVQDLPRSEVGLERDPVLAEIPAGDRRAAVDPLS